MRTLLVSTDGGHLAELVAVAERLPAEVVDNAVWACIDSVHSRSVLSGKHAEFVPRVKPKDYVAVVRSIPVAHRLHRKYRFDHVISTGSGIALSYLPYLQLRGVQAHYVESATRLTEPSVAGRVLQRVPGINLYTQYENLADERWHYAGWVYDRFRSTAIAPPPIKRAVVVLGTMRSYEFRRFLDYVVPLLRAGGALEQAQGFPVETLWQTGITHADGLDIDARGFVPSSELDAAIADADLVIGHAGAGTTLTALTAGRFPVLVPRAAAQNENMDDHQLLFARLLDERGIAMHREPETLTVDDLVTAASRRVEVDPDPEPFRLRL
jgi:UDP-N-acetylglucosamine--N-acetylmuramyl-(pentapeptide) pyrophosphoryl-undecaprenol N-acetylglucosamine transferase